MNDSPNNQLPDPLVFDDGTPVRSADEWPRRRREILETIVDIEYGGLPPAPPTTHARDLHPAKIKRLGGARFRNIGVTAETDPPVSFMLYALVPDGEGPFPVVVNGDGCWLYVSDEVRREALGRGIALAQFNRVEIAPDDYTDARDTGLYLAYPDHTFGAVAAWAWGYHRCVDVLTRMDEIDADRIAVVGHSRGGKTSLLAGATDERIAVTGANDSGAGGAGCYRIQGPESERIEHLMRNIAYWFGPKLKDYVGRETELPFDQHFLKALVAPRALVTTEALGDLWANPTGAWQTHRAAREVFKFLDAEDRIGIHYREGAHAHTLDDWKTFLDFAEAMFARRRAGEKFYTRQFEM